MRVPEPSSRARKVSREQRRRIDAGDRSASGWSGAATMTCGCGPSGRRLDHRLARRAAHDREVEPALGEGGDDLAAVADAELDLDVGKARASRATR